MLVDSIGLISSLDQSDYDFRFADMYPRSVRNSRNQTRYTQSVVTTSCSCVSGTHVTSLGTSILVYVSTVVSQNGVVLVLIQ